MPKAVAISKYVKVNPRKTREIAGLIRNKLVADAIFQLTNCPKKGARYLKKTLISAIANAENNLGLRREDLVVSEVRVDAGPFLKRAWSRSRGRRSAIQHKTSHLYIALNG
ncbi:MAG: 50S ribosomal protein L22 [Chlamydiae bacterium RIFCSPHIGHO2_12_FULL_49_11]|nr:MAG: 50S ribosomal protein L22 [Chlamydiae bacterium RIFCSPHIGHO2_12_FULL_49_11]